jgi:hypothetical protein
VYDDSELIWCLAHEHSLNVSYWGEGRGGPNNVNVEMIKKKKMPEVTKTFCPAGTSSTELLGKDKVTCSSYELHLWVRFPPLPGGTVGSSLDPLNPVSFSVQHRGV